MRTFSLFAALALMLNVSFASAAETQSAVLHAGDKLHVLVFGQADLSQDTVVAPDGEIGLPLAGQISVAGKTPLAASQMIALALKAYVRDPRVTVDVASEGHVNVTVAGDVVNSGQYSLRSGATLSSAIAAAGGMSPTIAGAYPIARISNADGTTNNISLEKLLRGGDPTRDIVLGDRTTIYVPGPTQFDIVVLGAVNHPGTLSINEGDRLAIAIAKAGNSAGSKADLSRIMVTRTEPDGTTASHLIDLYKSLNNADRRYDPLLREGDIVLVPMSNRAHDSLNNAVFLLGNVF